MTQPRRIVPGQFYLITRRVLLRTFLLRPAPQVNAAFEYCLAEAAQRHEIDVIAWCAMSNHYHAVVYDPKGQLPAFLEQFHKMSGKAFNARYRRRENFWSSEETCVTRLVTLDDVFDKVVYVLANPVAANLVEKVAHWPGASSWNRMNARASVVHRPAVYFRKDGVMPKSVSIRAVTPRGLVNETSSQWVSRVRKAVALREDVLSKQRARKGQRVVGAKAVRRANPFSTAATKEPRSALRPCLACNDAEKMKKARAELRGFRVHYRRMLGLLRADKRRRLCNGKERLAREKPKIEFPAGTYRLRVLLGVPCARFVAAA
jgi:putative transposase